MHSQSLCSISSINNSRLAFHCYDAKCVHVQLYVEYYWNTPIFFLRLTTKAIKTSKTSRRQYYPFLNHLLVYETYYANLVGLYHIYRHMKNPHQKENHCKGVIKPRRWCHHSMNVSEMEMDLAMVGGNLAGWHRLLHEELQIYETYRRTNQKHHRQEKYVNVCTSLIWAKWMFHHTVLQVSFCDHNIWYSALTENTYNESWPDLTSWRTHIKKIFRVAQDGISWFSFL